MFVNEANALACLLGRGPWKGCEKVHLVFQSYGKLPFKHIETMINIWIHSRIVVERGLGWRRIKCVTTIFMLEWFSFSLDSNCRTICKFCKTSRANLKHYKNLHRSCFNNYKYNNYSPILILEYRFSTITMAWLEPTVTIFGISSKCSTRDVAVCNIPSY